MKIAYLENNISDYRNATTYQRPLFLCKQYELFFFVNDNNSIPKEILQNSTVIKNGPSNVYLYHIWRLIAVCLSRRKLGIEYVYSFYSPFSIIEGFSLKMFGFKWIADVWDHPELEIEVREGGVISLIIRSLIPIVRTLLKKADLVICAIMPEALLSYKIPPSKIVSVTNGIDIDYIEKQSGLPCNKSLVPASKPVIFYVGYICDCRGIKTLLESFNIVNKKLNAQLVLVGKTIGKNTASWISQYLQNNDLGSSVSLLGELSYNETLSLMKQSEICVFPFPKLKGTEHIFPIKIFEYMLMKKPIIATNLKGISQLIKSGVNGLTVEPENPVEMANSIIFLLTNCRQYSKLSLEAFNRIKQYDWAVINARIANAISLLGQKDTLN